VALSVSRGDFAKVLRGIDEKGWIEGRGGWSQQGAIYGISRWVDVHNHTERDYMGGDLTSERKKPNHLCKRSNRENGCKKSSI